MLWIFRALAERLKALFVADAAADFQAQLLTRDAERKAELLRQAARYEEEGLREIGQQLRQRADTITLEQPLAVVLPALEHLGQHSDRSVGGLLPGDGHPGPAPSVEKPPVSSPPLASRTPKKNAS